MQASRCIVRAVYVALLPLIGGCAALPYVPNRPPVPLITHQGELNVSGGPHFPLSAGFDYQVVYAPWDHVSTYAGFQFDRGYGSSIGGPDSSDYNNRFFELGLGYFDSLSSGHYESYIHVGFGEGIDHQYFQKYSTSTDTTLLSVLRLGIQQNIGIEGSVGAIGVGLGLGYEHLFFLTRTATTYDWSASDSIPTITYIRETSPQSALYIQPVFFWRLGWKGVKIMEEYWFTFRTNHYPSFGDGNESLTLSLDF